MFDTTGNKMNKAMSKLMNASKEATQRAPAMSVWSDKYKARGSLYPFGLTPNQSSQVLFLSDPYVQLVHPYIVDWPTIPGGKSFPKTEYTECTKWKLDDDGNYVDSKNTCHACSVIGEPKLIATYITAGTEPFTSKDGSRTYKNPVRLLVASSQTTHKQLAEISAVDYVGGSLKYCIIKVSRSSNNKSPRVGDSFVFQKKMEESDLTKKDYWPAIADQLRAINLAEAYGPLTVEQQVDALTRHKAISDRHNDGRDYNAAAFEKMTKKGPVAEVTKKADGGGLAALDDVEENDSTEWNDQF